MQSNRIEVAIDFGSNDRGALQTLQELRLQLNLLNRSTQDITRQFGQWAGGRFIENQTAQIRGQITALERLGAEAQEAASKMLGLQQSAMAAARGTLGPFRVDVVDGEEIERADRSIRSAAASARVLATSLSAAANADDQLRQSAMAVAAVHERIAAIAERSASIRRGVTGEVGVATATGALAPTAKEVQQLYNESVEVAGKIRPTLESAFAPPNSLRQTQTMLRSLWAEMDRTSGLIRQRQTEATEATVAQVQQILTRGVGGIGSVPLGEGGLVSNEELRRLPSPEQLMININRAAGIRAAREGTGSFFGRINRQGALEAQAAVVNTVQALASGMNPLHVAIMESAQIAGAAVQGGLLSLKDIWAAMASPIGLATGAMAAASSVIALVGLRAYQASEAVKSVHDSFRILGQSQLQFAQPVQIQQERGRLSERFGLTTTDINAITTAFNTSSAAVSEHRSRLHDLVVGYAAVANIDIAMSAEMFGKAAEAGGAGFIALTEKMNIGDSSWRRNLQRMVETGAEGEALNIVIDAMTERFGRAGAAVAEGASSMVSMRDRWEQLKASMREGPMAVLNWIVTGRPPVDIGQLAPETPPAIRAGRQVTANLRPEEEKRLDIQRQFTALLRAEGEIRREIARSQLGILKEANIDPKLIEELKNIQLAMQNLAAQEAPRSAAEEQAHRTRLARLQEELAFAESMAQKDAAAWERVLDLRKKIEDEITSHVKGALDERGAAYKRESEEAIKAATDTAAAIRAADEAYMRRDIEEEDRLTQLRKQQADYAQNAALATLRQQEALATARQDLSAIVELRRQEAALITADPYKSSADRINAQTAILQAQIQAQKQSIQLTQQAAQEANSFASQRLNTQTALMDLEVAQGTRTREEAIAGEAALTQRVMAEQQRRLQSLLQIQGLEPSQRAQINNQLADLYEQDAQKQIELQTRLTEAIKAENERRTQYFRNFFQSVESGAANLLIAGLNRTQTRSEALRSLAQNLVSSFTREMTSMGSQFAGRGLADVFGLKLGRGEDTSISRVLALSLGQSLGITTPAPQIDQAVVQQKMQLAAEAHQTAAQSLQQAAAALMRSAQASPYRGGADPELSNSVDSIRTSITPMTSAATEAATRVGQDLAPAASEAATALRQIHPERSGLVPEGSATFGPRGFVSPETDSGNLTIRNLNKINESNEGLGKGASTLNQGFNLASSAASMFGAQLSTTGRMIQGTLGLVSGTASFLGNAFGTTAAVTQTAAAATTTLQSANLVNTVATTSNTIATQTNSAAQTAAAASATASSGGSILGGFLKMIPIVGSLFGEQGMVVPSAQSGMTVDDGRGGRLAILHPREMVLPANISIGLQNLIASSGMGRLGQGLSQVNHSGGNVFNFNAQARTSGSRREMEMLLRRQGNQLRDWVENLARNNWRPA